MQNEQRPAGDEYEISGEFLDLLIAPHWHALAPALQDALVGVDDTAGPVLDIGSGSGRALPMIDAVLSDAEIWASEPARTLRSILLATVAASPRLRDKVTVIDHTPLAAALPDSLSAVVAINVIGHFTPTDRGRLWDLLAERLAPGGRMVLNLQPPSTPEPVPETAPSSVHIGRRRYEGRGRAEVAGPDSVTWRMTYRVYHDEVLQAEHQVDYDWWVLNEATLRSETTARGLRTMPVGPSDLAMYAIDRARQA
ncbi:class I SAM-dependent methyltransferase [Actinoalloteichus fjordicus]|uniref:Methyltransferase domain n=1 Tax=Actinoalloteichus fjordicus TaxID=1612552 RepID=A0AAC9PT03_9PSEU|nr:class I SAM-dependent methyltransferase [Actinoalloteichus fjordicus]APU15351.1 Methyltransferase domain [Actinoalloteichus fjordicus]